MKSSTTIHETECIQDSVFEYYASQDGKKNIKFCSTGLYSLLFVLQGKITLQLYDNIPFNLPSNQFIALDKRSIYEKVCNKGMKCIEYPLCGTITADLFKLFQQKNKYCTNFIPTKAPLHLFLNRLAQKLELNPHKVTQNQEIEFLSLLFDNYTREELGDLYLPLQSHLAEISSQERE